MSLSLAIAMTTAPRGKPTVDRALASTRAAGFDQPITLMEDAEKIGPLPTWGRTLAMLLNTDADFLMILQDDVTWAAGSRKVLEREIETMGERAKSAGLLSPFLVNKIGREFTRRNLLKTGWHASELGYASGGALCYVLPRKSAETLVADETYQEFMRTRPRNIDRLIPGRLSELGLACLFRYPSLINHRLGSGNSSIKEKKPHDTNYWQAVA